MWTSDLDGRNHAPSLAVALRHAQHGRPVGIVCPPDEDGACTCGGKWSRKDRQLVPHDSKEVGKAPVGRLMPNGIGDATTNTASIDRWWHEQPNGNASVELWRSGLFVVDADSPEAEASALSNGLDGGVIRDSRNRAYVFKRPDDCPKVNLIKAEGDPLDILTFGNFIVHGTHQTGCPIYMDPDAVPGPAPAWAVGMVKQKACERAAQDAAASARRAERVAKNASRREPPVRLDGEAISRWNGELVEKRDGQLDRSSSLFFIGLALAEKGATEVTIVAALEERDATLGWHKFTTRSDDGEYVRIAEKVVAHVVEQERGPRIRFGSSTSPDKLRSGQSESITEVACMRVMTVGDLLALDLPEPRHVVVGIVPEGLTLVGGKSKIGKSWLTLGESIAVAAGGKALGKIDVDRGEVLALTLEDTARRLQGRLEAMLGTSPPPAGLHIATEWPRADQGGLEALEAWLTVHPATRLIVVDTWPKFRPPRAKNADAFQDDYQAATALKRIADAHPGLAIIVVIHLRKAPADDWVDSINATSGVAAAADAISVIVRDRGRADAVLKVTGRDLEERELALTWDAEISGWVYVGPAEEFRRSQERAELIRVLAKADRPLAPREIVPQVKGKNAATVRWLLAEMVKDGQAVKAGRGLYTVPNNANKPTTPSAPQPSYPVASPEPAAPIVGGSDVTTNTHQQWVNGETTIVGAEHAPSTTHQQPLPDRNGAIVGVVGKADIVDEEISPDDAW